MLNIVEATDHAKYSEILEEVIDELNGVEILRLSYGHEEVDIDVLLENGMVFSLHYDSDDCNWWDKIQEKFVKEEMWGDSVCYGSLEMYQAKKAREGWRFEPLSHA